MCTLLPSHIRATCPAHLILLDFTTATILGKEYRSLSSSLCNFLHSPVTSTLLGPNTLLSTLFSNTLSLRSSLSVSDQDSHPYRTTGNIIVLLILIFKFLDSKLEDKRTDQTTDFNHCSFFAGPECSRVICDEVRQVVSTERDSLRGNQTGSAIPPTKCAVFTDL